MKKLFLALFGLVFVIVGCSQVTQTEPVQLEAQRIDYCNFAGGPIISSGRIIAEGAADCRFIRDGRDSGRAIGYLQKSVFNTQTQSYEWHTINQSKAQTWTLPSTVEVGWHFFGILRAYASCQSAAYRTAVIVTWPAGGTNTEMWASPGRQLNC